MSQELPHGRFLGQASRYPSSYSPQVLEPVPRLRGRASLLGGDAWPHYGVDIWTLYEAAFLGPDGRPHVGVGTLSVPCTSANIVESKSLKLYLFSLNRERFAHREAYAQRVCADVAAVVGAPVQLHWLDDVEAYPRAVGGSSIDGAPFASLSLEQASQALEASGPQVTEILTSELLRSLCPVTAQPDWATMVVRYAGPRIHREALLHYIAAFHDHQGFHEQCVERIFLDLMRACRCTQLTVFARYTRRGGIDINPLRSTQPHWEPMARTFRQ